jgi:hypothetical protein
MSHYVISLQYLFPRYFLNLSKHLPNLSLLSYYMSDSEMQGASSHLAIGEMRSIRLKV